MKLTTTTQVSVDGVMQGPGGPEEDERGRFERGGWAHFDNEAGTAMDEIYQRADAFLFGRRTYEIFAGSWGTWDDPGDSPIWTALNAKPKYVASTTLTDPRWKNTTVFSSELAAAIRELKAQPGGELQVHGCGVLSRWLLDNNLVDEMNLFIFPVVVGQGTRLFPEIGRDRALELVESRATPSGVTIQVYRPAGRPQYAREADDAAMSDTAAVIAQFNAAFLERAPQKLVELIAADCVMEGTGPAPDGNVWRGYDECLAGWQGLASDPTIQFEVDHVDVDGDRAVIRWRVTGAQDYRGVNLMRLRDGKIVEALGYGKRS
jgi:dihydrofolate reductase